MRARTSSRRVRFVFAVDWTGKRSVTHVTHLPLTLFPFFLHLASRIINQPSHPAPKHTMSQEQDPFVGEGEEDDTLIMAPLLVEKLQVCPARRPSVAESIPNRHLVLGR